MRVQAHAPRLYRAFGAILSSDVALHELHELPEGSATPEWRLALATDEIPAADDAEVVGSEDIAYGGHVELRRLGDGRYRLTYSDTGTFDIDADAGRMTWWRPEGCDDDLAAMDILGRVLATLLHAKGMVTLHASAVEVDGVAIGFMAPKFHGKSTLAAAMTYAGARLVSDDALAILPGHPPRCVPGVPSMRLREESAAHFERTSGIEAPELPRWRVVDMMGHDMVPTAPLPLAALYVLSPQPADAEVAVRRVPLSPLEAMLALTRFAKMGTLLGDREGHRHVSSVVDVVHAVPVHSLELVRDLKRIDEVTATIVGWHRASPERA